MTFTIHEILNNYYSRLIASICQNSTIILSSSKKIQIFKTPGSITTVYDLDMDSTDEQQFKVVMLLLG